MDVLPKGTDIIARRFTCKRPSKLLEEYEGPAEHDIPLTGYNDAALHNLDSYNKFGEELLRDGYIVKSIRHNKCGDYEWLQVAYKPEQVKRCIK